MPAKQEKPRPTKPKAKAEAQAAETKAHPDPPQAADPNSDPDANTWHARFKTRPGRKEELEPSQGHIRKLIHANGWEATGLSDPINDKVNFLFSVEHSTAYLSGYATLDFELINNIVNFQQKIRDYIDEKHNRQRPLNFMMLASPGEGKSHFIDCIANVPELKNDIKKVLFNMATMQSAQDLKNALDEARNVTIAGKIPLIFLDEFDSSEAYYSLLLPLLWDGEIELGARPLKVGRAVIVLAGSNRALLDALEKARNMTEEEVSATKLVDLLSRINGGIIEIPSLRAKGERDRRIDKVCIAVALLRRQYGLKHTPGLNSTLDPSSSTATVKSVPASLLNFIYHITFKYGVRSITHLLELIRPERGDSQSDELAENTDIRSEGAEDQEPFGDDGVLNVDGLSRVLLSVDEITKAGLIYHIIHPDQARGIKETWEQSLDVPGYVPIWCLAFERFELPASWNLESFPKFIVQLISELKGKHAEFVDVSALAAIKPYYLTKLMFNERLGEWDHGLEGMRHLFFNLATLQQILSAAVGTALEPLVLGHRMGTSFGVEFVNLLKKLNEPLDVQSAISNWCRFDISGGWGLFEYKAEASELWVLNNFFAEHLPGMEIAESSRFCPIMRGYIQGVLEEIAFAAGRTKEQADNIERPTVEVKESACGYPTPEKHPCKFQFVIRY